VRITVSHTKPKEEVVQMVNRALDDLFKGAGALPVRFEEKQRSWQGSTLAFALTARMGLLSTPIKGTVEVTDRDITIDADLGLLERMVSGDKARDMISSRVRGLLK
jgi:hypothetical protein